MKTETQENTEFILQWDEATPEILVAVLVDEHLLTLYRFLEYLYRGERKRIETAVVETIRNAVGKVSKNKRDRFQGQTTPRAWLLHSVPVPFRGRLWQVGHFLNKAGFDAQEIAFVCDISTDFVNLILADETFLYREPYTRTDAQIIMSRANTQQLVNRIQKPTESRLIRFGPQLGWAAALLVIFLSASSLIYLTDRTLFQSQNLANDLSTQKIPDSSPRHLIRISSTDLAAWQNQQILHGHSGWVKTVAFSPDGSLLASGGIDGTVHLWDAQGAVEVSVLEIPFNLAITDVAFSPRGNLLAVASLDGALTVWDLTGDVPEMVLYEEMFYAGNLHRLVFSPRGNYLAGGTETGVWLGRVSRDLEFELITNLSSSFVMDLAFSKSNTRLYAADINGIFQFDWESYPTLIETIDVTQVVAFDPIRRPRGEIFQLAASANGRYLAFGGENNQVDILEIFEGPEGLIFQKILDIPLQDRIRDLSFSDDGQYLGIVAEDDGLHVLNIFRDVMASFSFPWPRNRMFSVAFSPDYTLAAGATVGQIHLLGSGKPEP